MELDNLHFVLAAIVIGMAFYIYQDAADSLVKNESKSKSFNKTQKNNTKSSKKKKDVDLEECPTNYPVITGAVVSGSSACCIVVMILLVFIAIHLKVPELIGQLAKLAI
jgi:hypothetical protein